MTGDRRALAASRAGHGHRAGVGSIRYATHGKSGDLRRRVPARHAGRLRGSRISAGEVGAHVRLLRRGKCAAEHRSRPSALARRVGSSLEPGASLRSVQRDKRRPAASRSFFQQIPSGWPRSKTNSKSPLKDAAAVNATRWALYRALADTGLPVSTGSGGRTKFNRHRFSIPKAHALDAVCAGNMDHDHGGLRLAAADALDLSERPRIVQADPPHGPWISARIPDAEQIGSRVHDRRHGPSQSCRPARNKAPTSPAWRCARPVRSTCRPHRSVSRVFHTSTAACCNAVTATVTNYKNPRKELREDREEAGGLTHAHAIPPRPKRRGIPRNLMNRSA